MSAFRLLALTAATVLVSACSMADSYSEVKALNGAQASGSPFTQQLTSEYRAYSNYLLKDMMDYADSLHFARKGLASAKGENVMPEAVSDWKLNQAQESELAQARNRLISAIDRGAREVIPGKTAVAQARFDCWIEQTEASVNDSGKKGVADCKGQFMAAMQEIEGAIPANAPAAPAEALPAPVGMTETAPQPMDTKEAMYLVFFDFDKSTIGEGGNNVVDQVVTEVKNRNINTVHVVGHADRSGSESYNNRLSTRRATAVKKALEQRGVKASISTDARGESEPLVSTADGVREPANRRAVITFE